MAAYIYKLSKDKWGKTYADILAELLDPEFTDSPSFGWEGEGIEMPSGLEPVSWQILTKEEKVLGFWLEWDPKKNAPDGSKGYYSLRRDVKEHRPNSQNPGYIRARKELNLPLTKEQERIFKETNK